MYCLMEKVNAFFSAFLINHWLCNSKSPLLKFALGTQNIRNCVKNNAMLATMIHHFTIQ